MKKTLIALAAALPLLSAPVFATSALADTWTVDKDASKLTFHVKQAEGEIAGSFQTWQASIDFDPAAPEKAVIKADIETASAVTGNRQYDDMLAQPDYFDAKTATTATFETTSVISLDEGAYKAEGTLTIKGISQPVILEFTLDIDGDTAHATGTASLSRSAYEMGASIGANTLADAVTVDLDLTASR